MGLTIHYSLNTTIPNASAVRTIVALMRVTACTLPFAEVGDVVEFTGDHANFDKGDRDDPYRWLKIQAGTYLHSDDFCLHVLPTHILAFSTQSGEGCELANFGFCQYPRYVTATDSQGRTRRRATGLSGWSWGSFCKTQHASNPECGGVENFLRCHLTLIRFLDLIQSRGDVAVKVNDEGDYWTHRDPERLARQVGEWNEMIAAWYGAFKDAYEPKGQHVEAPIRQFPNFEHLEARGADRMRRTSPSSQ